MNRKTLARPYARALFSYISERGDLSRFSEILKVLKTLSLDKEIIRIYKDSSIPKGKVVEIVLNSVESITSSYSDREVKHLGNFLKLVIKNKRFQLLDEIENLYDNYLMQKRNTLAAEVISSHKLSKSERYIVQEYLQKNFSKSVSLKYRTKKTLIGGLVIRSNEWTLDLTIEGKLRHLTKALSK